MHAHITKTKKKLYRKILKCLIQKHHMHCHYVIGNTMHYSILPYDIGHTKLNLSILCYIIHYMLMLSHIEL